ncbi:MAG: DUF805 domain-containing protein [Actinomycetota bacterium]|nr:DUF805 domain-containing protein [Actinomycetota bacterium]
MGFGQAITHVLRNYVNFRGRATRSEFWWFTLLMVIVYITLFIMSSAGIATSADPQLWGVLAQVGSTGTLVWFLATIIPVSAVWFRRLHDSNKSGWWYVLTIMSGFSGFVFLALSALQNQVAFTIGMVLGLASGIGGIVLLIFALLPSTSGPNRYGDGSTSVSSGNSPALPSHP